MKRFLFCCSFFAFFKSQAQQINPVPDYVFRNQMSVGRSAITDTAAYFSVGPRFGATKGLMPPMVVDTATFSGSKRNGLFIFSVQKNKFVYWDSIGTKWAEMAGVGGTAISSGDTTSMLTPYVRIAGSGLLKNSQTFRADTVVMATRARVQKAVDSLVGVISTGVTATGTTNYIPKFTGTSAIGNSIAYDNGTELLVNTSSDAGAYVLQASGAIYNTTSAALATTSGTLMVGTTTANGKLHVEGTAGSSGAAITTNSNASNVFLKSFINSASDITFDNNSGNLDIYTGGGLRTRIKTDGEYLVGSSTDAGAYVLQASGAIYNTGSAAFAVSSGSVSIGTTSAQTALTVQTSGESKANFQGGTGSETGINFGDASNNAIGRLVYDNNGDYMAFFTNNTKRMTLKNDGEFLLNTTGSDNGNFLLQVNGNAYVQLETILGATGDFGAYTLQVTGDAIFDGAIVTQEPGGGILNKIPWKLGNANTVSPTSPNRTITVLINGTTYYIHAKTTND